MRRFIPAKSGQGWKVTKTTKDHKVATVAKKKDDQSPPHDRILPKLGSSLSFLSLLFFECIALRPFFSAEWRHIF